MQLYEHQEKALAQTEQFNRVGYFLDMGLGKTFVGSEKMIQLGSHLNLLICQKSKIQDWIEHFRTVPNKSGFLVDDVFDLTDRKQSAMFQKVIAYEELPPSYMCVGVINYDLLFRRSYIGHIKGFTLILDESQKIKNETAKRSKAVLSLKPDNVILLSGTPSSGKYEKLWSQVQLLGWDISKIAYWNSFIETEWVEDGSTGFKRQQVTGYKNVERLKRKLAAHGAVFMKTEEVFDLPEQREINVMVKTSKEYKHFMKTSYIDLDLLNLCQFHDDSDFYGKDVTPHIELVGDTTLVKFLYARQLCGQYSKDKIQAFADLVESTGDRLIVFYNFNEELNAMMKVAKEFERPVSLINGAVKDKKSYEECDDSITFVQYQAGAEGQNLQKACKTIYFSLPFGKGSCDLWQQSKKRTHRIGQANQCLYYYLICKGSIEERNLINLRLGKEYDDRLFEKECT